MPTPEEPVETPTAADAVIVPPTETPPVETPPTSATVPSEKDAGKPESFFGGDKVAPKTNLPEVLVAEFPTLAKFSDVTMLAKAYAESEKTIARLGANQSKAPETYDPTIVPKGLHVAPEVFTTFKELGLTDAQAAGVLGASVGIVKRAEEMRMELERDRLMMDRGMRSPAEFEAWRVPLEKMAIEVLGENAAKVVGQSISGVLAIETMMRERAQRDQMPRGNPLAESMATATGIEDERRVLRTYIVDNKDWRSSPEKTAYVAAIEKRIEEMKGAA